MLLGAFVGKFMVFVTDHLPKILLEVEGEPSDFFISPKRREIFLAIAISYS